MGWKAQSCGWVLHQRQQQLLQRLSDAAWPPAWPSVVSTDKRAIVSQHIKQT